MTKDVIPGSQNKVYDEQVEQLKELSQNTGVAYEVPYLLDAATRILMEYLRTGTRLYNDSIWTYTRCQERVSEHPTWPLIVGGFAKDSLGVHTYDIESDVRGLGGLRRFL